MFSQRNNPYCDLLHFSVTRLYLNRIYTELNKEKFFLYRDKYNKVRKILLGTGKL